MQNISTHPHCASKFTCHATTACCEIIAIAIALPGCNDFGCLVTSIFLFNGSFAKAEIWNSSLFTAGVVINLMGVGMENLCFWIELRVDNRSEYNTRKHPTKLKRYNHLTFFCKRMIKLDFFKWRVRWKRASGILRKLELCQKRSKFRMQFCLDVLNNVLHVFPLKLTSFLRYYVCE